MATMLRALSPSRLQRRLLGLPVMQSGGPCIGGEKRFPLLRILGSLGKPSCTDPSLCGRAFFSSESGGDPEQPVEPSSAIVPTNPRPEDHLSVSSLSSMNEIVAWSSCLPQKACFLTKCCPLLHFHLFVDHLADLVVDFHHGIVFFF